MRYFDLILVFLISLLVFSCTPVPRWTPSTPAEWARMNALDAAVAADYYNSPPPPLHFATYCVQMGNTTTCY